MEWKCMKYTEEKSIEQNTYIYNIISGEKWIEDMGKVTVYGLCAYSYAGGSLEKPIEKFAVKDISNNLQDVLTLQSLMERNKVSLVHVPDVIDDFLAACQ